MLKTVDEVVKALGGTNAAAALAGVGAPAVSNWKARGVITPEHFMIFSMALAKIGKIADPTVFGFKSSNVEA
jgi:hypothetical protein